MGLFGSNKSSAVSSSTVVTTNIPVTASDGGRAYYGSQIVNEDPSLTILAAGELLQPAWDTLAASSLHCYDLMAKQIDNAMQHATEVEASARTANATAAGMSQRALEVASGRAFAAGLPIDWNALIPIALGTLTVGGIILMVLKKL